MGKDAYKDASSAMQVTSPDGTSYYLNELITTASVMDIFDVTKVTVYNWLGKSDGNEMYPDGKFPHAFKFGGQIYIPVIDVKDAIKKKQQKL